MIATVNPLDDHTPFRVFPGMMFFGQQEFIEGAARLRGTAKALDVWRMETKVEVLFEEVLNLGFAKDFLRFLMFCPDFFRPGTMPQPQWHDADSDCRS